MDKQGDSFLGYYVSMVCDNDSTYEGEVCEIDAAKQLITLTHAHQIYPDGSSMTFPRITLTGNHVKSLKIIRERINIHEPEEMKSHHQNTKARKSPNDEVSSRKTVPQQGKTKRKNGCFDDDITKIQTFPDFDFQENNAKFDKQAVFEKMQQNSENVPNSAPLFDPKMRSQDNILESEPVSLRQIKVPLEHAGKEYSTEDGFIIPAITLSLKMKLLSAAEKAGLSLQQLVESGGICTCQMALQLVGGALRLNPKNNHQRPEIVVLAGCHTQGMQAISAARHLVNHTAKVILYFPDSSPVSQPQVDLFLKAGGKLIKMYKDLPSQPVDMIIDAMVGLESQHALDWLPYVISWANQNKAPLLSIDPCMPSNSKIELPNIKWSIAMGLPLIKSPKAGRVYLADLGIPRGVFKDVGIQYMSPFKDKFYIPLYDY